MPQFTIGTPDGRQVTVQADNQDAAIQGVQQWAQSNPRDNVGNLPDLGHVGNALEAGVVGFGHQILGLGDVAGTAGTMAQQAIHGQPVDWDHAHQIYNQVLKDAQTKYPVSFAAGSVAGGADTVVASAPLAKIAGSLLPGSRLLTPVAGQAVRNVARAAAGGVVAGAGYGAAQGASEGAQDSGASGAVTGAEQGAAAGAVTGGVLGAAAPVVGGAFKAARGVLAPLDTKVANILGKMFSESPEDIQAAVAQHVDATGRPPSMAEIASLKAQAAIKGAAGDSGTIGAALINRQAALEQETQGTVAAQIPGATAENPTGTSEAAAANYKTARSNENYDAVRAQSFPVGNNKDDLDWLKGDVAPNVDLGRLGRASMAKALESGNLTGEDVDALRQAIGAKANGNGPDVGKFKAMASDFDSLFGDPEKFGNAALAYSQAVGEHAANATFQTGAGVGRGIIGHNSGDYIPQVEAAQGAVPTTPEGAPTGEPAQALPGSENKLAGIKAGATNALAGQTETPGSALTLARRYAGDNGLYNAISTTFGKDAADSARKLGAAEASANDAMGNVTPRLPAGTSDVKDGQNLIQGAVGAAQLTTNPLWSAYHIARMFQGLGMSKPVQAKVASYLTDPKMVNAGVNILRKASPTPSAFRQTVLRIANLAVSNLPGIAGNLAGGAVAPQGAAQ